MTLRMIDCFASEENVRHAARIATLLAMAVVAGGCASATPAPTTPSASTTDPAHAGDAPLLSQGRTWTARFYGHETQAMWDQFSPTLQQRMKAKSSLDEFQSRLERTVGKEVKLLEEHIEQIDNIPFYVRTAAFNRSGEIFAVQIGFTEGGRIENFRIAPVKEDHEAATTHLAYVTRTPLRLPFDGEWFVSAGGRTIAQNHHTVVKNQRFAYDFNIMRDGASHKGTGEANTDYWCFGQPIVAPGAGRIVVAIDGIDDNIPGETNHEHIAGNHVFIDHGQGEFSFLAHLQKNSLKVKVGDVVEAGAPIGACGSSGNTAGPHLHYHLQDSAVFATGDGLPPQFLNYTADGKHVDRGEPVRLQRIKNDQP